MPRIVVLDVDELCEYLGCAYKWFNSDCTVHAEDEQAEWMELYVVAFFLRYYNVDSLEYNKLWYNTIYSSASISAVFDSPRIPGVEHRQKNEFHSYIYIFSHFKINCIVILKPRHVWRYCLLSPANGIRLFSTDRQKLSNYCLILMAMHRECTPSHSGHMRFGFWCITSATNLCGNSFVLSFRWIFYSFVAVKMTLIFWETRRTFITSIINEIGCKSTLSCFTLLGYTLANSSGRHVRICICCLVWQSAESTYCTVT